MTVVEAEMLKNRAAPKNASDKDAQTEVLRDRYEGRVKSISKRCEYDNLCDN